jgi:hypothetical protein
MTSLTSIGKEIHKRRAAIFIIEKAQAGELPYVLQYKDHHQRDLLKIQKEKEMKALIQEREIFKMMTPKKEWYPRKRYCGRYKGDNVRVRARIMRETFLAGFNPKEIAGYFQLDLVTIYKYLNVRKLKLVLAQRRLNS